MKNIIFDVDGTLWDSTEVVAQAWNKAIAEVGKSKTVVSSDILKKEFGKTMKVIADNLFQDADEAAHRAGVVAEFSCLDGRGLRGTGHDGLLCEMRMR